MADSRWLRLHVAPRDVRRWMVDVGFSLAHYKLRPDAPVKIRTKYLRSLQRWLDSPDGQEAERLSREAMKAGAIGIYSGVLWVEGFSASEVPGRG